MLVEAEAELALRTEVPPQATVHPKMGLLMGRLPNRRQHFMFNPSQRQGSFQ